ncbi:hypothetical protein [Ferrimicrobium sp.]|uniref:hypothetical protein n=1 Tax=Ferrimicrobium sp. TaxID=2926050 RepID=UPI0026231992|nr:hypothetical protein [Ferrimicrobium sp.]
MDPDEFENILNGDSDTASETHLARLIRTAQAPATTHELAAEDLAVAAFRRSVVLGSAQRRRVFSRLTPLKVAAAAAAFVVVGGGFTAALTHAFARSGATTRPSVSPATQPKTQPNSPRPQIAPSKENNGPAGQQVPSASEQPTNVASGQNKSKKNSKGKHNGQGKGMLVTPGQVGSAMPTSYHGLCLSYSKALTDLQGASAPTTRASKLQTSKQFLQLAESALNRGMTVPEFCSMILGTKVPNPSVPGFGLNSSASTGDGNGSGSSSKTGGQPTGARPGPSGSGNNGGGGGIVSAGVPAKLP